MSHTLPDMGGARCALHPEVSSFTCSRCGNFACEQCRAASDARLCQPCEVRAAPQALPPHRSITLGGLLGDVFQQFSRNLLAIGLLGGFSLLSTLAVVLVFVTLLGAPSVESLMEGDAPSLPPGFWGPFLLTLVLWTYLHCAGAAGFIRWTADGMREQGERSPRALVRAGLAGGAVLFLILVLYFLATWGATTVIDELIRLMGALLGPLNPLIRLSIMLLTLFIIPYISIVSSLAPASAVLEGGSPVNALQRSAALVKGHRMRLLGLYAILGMLAFGGWIIGMVVIALLEMAGDLGRMGSILMFILQGVTVSLFLLASTVAYVRLRPVELPPLSSQEAPVVVMATPAQLVETPAQRVDTPARSESAEGEPSLFFRNV